MKRLIDVYVYRFRHEKPEFLLFLRSSKKIYANQWRMIGGKVEEGEPYWKAALREFNEETGLSPDNFWVIPSVNTFYEAQSDQIHQIPAFAIEIAPDKTPVLDDEHTDFRWISIEELDSYLSWPEQKRLIRLTHNILINDQILPEWQLDTP
ncbi:MAG TPA: NUDIX domain-containing protein [Balneolaceae bacterium]|nr:NUDIX domain-containing protein [Balneolaceae bacterium]|tara:strand:+ start:132543 stop:132995 length:453 start_codon:yes stop_codon:yes gene_type:complete